MTAIVNYSSTKVRCCRKYAILNLMLLIHEDKRKRTIKKQEEIKFSSTSPYHLIILTVRSKAEKQISDSSTDDEDLIVRIDDKTFPQIGSNKLLNSPAAFSGAALHNLAKTVYFLISLQGKDHKLILKTDNPPGTATFEELKIYTLDRTDKLTLEPKIQAEDGDRREWLTFVLDNLPLEEVSVTITYARRKRDSDDVKIKIDGQTQGNFLGNIKHFLWYFVGSLIPRISSIKSESQTFISKLSSGLHYIELDADRMPTLEKIILNLGSLPVKKRIPTVDDPEWTGNFADDTEEMLLARAIYGEAGGESKQAKIAVGWTIRNRVEDSRNRWGKTYHEVILQPFQYEPFNDPKSRAFKKITNPQVDDEIEEKAWRESFEAATEVIHNKVPDPTNGANHFYVPLPDYPTPNWVDDEKFTLQIVSTRFYKL